MYGKDYNLGIKLKGMGDIEFPIEFNETQMLVASPDGNNTCRLPFAELSEESSENKHMVLGSFVLQKYAIQVDLEDQNINIGLKNASYVAPKMEPVDPVKPDDPSVPGEGKHSGIVIATVLIGCFIFAAAGLFAAYKLGYICNKKDIVVDNREFGDMKKGLNQSDRLDAS